MLGVGIGAKYAIEHDLVSPLTRIVLGYLAGLGLLAFALKLKREYLNFSAVLLSGAMAIFYFITYAAYDFYALIPQGVAFGLMVVFTVFTVVAALQYNMAVIAHFGLVGAYAVPILLSDGSGRVAILFSYMAILNAGILLISFSRQWKSLVYTAFGLSWLVYMGWFALSYTVREPSHWGIAFGFLALFFLIFYSILLAYKLLRLEQFQKDDVVLLLFNAFIFYGVGYALIQDLPQGEELLGLFTLLNALLHFGVAVLIYRRRLADRTLFYLMGGLVLVFITLAVPVQLEGQWVSLLWALQAALLFWIGRSRGVSFYESLSYALMLLAFGSILHDWSESPATYFPEGQTQIRPVLNGAFLLTLLFTAAFGLMSWLNLRYPPALTGAATRLQLLRVGLPAVFLLALYQLFGLEIARYWEGLYQASYITYTSADYEQVELSGWDHDLLLFRRVWMLNYSLLFLSLLALVNQLRIRSRPLGLVNLGLNGLLLLVFLWGGLLALSELRESYLSGHMAEYYQRGPGHVLIRYFSFLFLGGMLWTSYRYLRTPFMALQQHRPQANMLLYGVLLWILSSELIHWMDMAGSSQTYKFGLSLLWGAYALLLIVLGIWKRQKALRIGAIVLFAVTLIKLFFYDIVHLDTIAKTVVFVSLGVLLLIISFLYNKYKALIFDEPTA
ncbi:putative membrane protein [Cesiribacter andamanensis AMV16]|uniref:Putative membrane protein n=1 Tax=Cesiribacter andamanensis AMV16 TaxID=1279009 RepID=M7N195_9BACT|nr:putative membrane protein [Cesiribacter andamanensis AMV16]